MKRVWKVLLVLAAVVVVAVLIAFWQIDSIGKSAVESAGQGALGVTTTVDSMSIGVFGGEVSWSGLFLGNPAGFETPHFLTMRNGHVAVTLGTLMDDRVVLPKIHLAGIDINLEKSKQGANYETILDHASKGEKEEEPASDEPGKVFTVEEVLIEDITVHAEVRLLTKRNVTVNIPELRLLNVASDDPAALKGVTRKLVRAILAAVLETGLLPKEIDQGLAKGLVGVVDVSKLGIKGVKGATSKVLEGAADGLGKGVKDAVGGLFGGDKKKEEEDE